MHYQIFIPKEGGADPRKLAKVGLGHLLGNNERGPEMADVLDHGPDGGPGLIFTWPGSLPAYRPGELQWFPAKPDKAANLAAGRFWWGYNPAQPPTADELLRGVTLKGKPYSWRGNIWLVPNVLLLPHRFELDDEGEEVRVVDDTHKHIGERAVWAFNAIKTSIETETPKPEKELRRYALEMLSLNYRLFRDLAHRMGILHDDSWYGFCLASLDLDTLLQVTQEVAKKKRLARPAPTPPISTPGVGVEASPRPGTDQQSGTSS